MLWRIELIVKSLGITITEFEREIGVSESSIKNGLKGNSGPRTELYLKIYRRYNNVNIHWLITGDGDMLLKQPERGRTMEEPASKYQTSLMEVMKQQNDALTAQNEFLKQQVELWQRQCERWQEEYDKCRENEAKSKAG